MESQTTTESARNNTGTARTPDTWANQDYAFTERHLHEDASVNDAEAVAINTDGSARMGKTEAHVVETVPTYTDLFNYYTKPEVSKTH